MLVSDTDLTNTGEIRNLEIKVSTVPAPIGWNMTDALKWAEDYGAKWVGAKVTDENLPVMKEAVKDLKSKVKRLEEIRLEQKRAIMVPYETFATELAKVSAALQKVIDPLEAQTKEYTEARRAEKFNDAVQIIADLKAVSGLRPKYAEQVKMEDSWAQLSATKKGVREEVRARIAALQDAQRQEDAAIEAAKQRAEMIVTMMAAQSAAFGLTIALTPQNVVIPASASLSEATTIIIAAAAKQRDAEAAAIRREDERRAEAARKEEEAKAAAAALIIKQQEAEAERKQREANRAAAAEAIEQMNRRQAEADAMTEEAQKAGENVQYVPEPAMKQTFVIFGTGNELDSFAAMLEANGYTFTKGNKEEVEA